MTDDHGHRGWRRLGTLFRSRARPHRDAATAGARKHADRPRRISRLYATLGIDVVFDVGAADGQFGQRLRRSGYLGRIVSFEPRSAAVAAARTVAAADPSWTVRHEALGDIEQDMPIHISGHAGSSSLLTMLASHERASPDSGTVGTEQVRVRRFDTLPDDVTRLGDHPAMKLDTQGFELAALQGTGRHLGRLELIQVELSLVPLYADAPLHEAVSAFLVGAGFRLAGIVPGFEDPASGQLLQMDGVFVRGDRLPVTGA